jgi:hypothetical protein
LAEAARAAATLRPWSRKYSRLSAGVMNLTAGPLMAVASIWGRIFEVVISKSRLLTRLAPKVHWPLIAIGVTGASGVLGVLGYHARNGGNLHQNRQLVQNYFRHCRFFFRR